MRLFGELVARPWYPYLHAGDREVGMGLGYSLYVTCDLQLCVVRRLSRQSIPKGRASYHCFLYFRRGVVGPTEVDDCQGRWLPSKHLSDLPCCCNCIQIIVHLLLA